ncbi:MAG: flagellar basal body rod C-terminal domain-containing protein, partial [Pseudomonadota bacterium]
QVALDLASVADNDVALGGTATLVEGYSALVGFAGSAMQRANAQLDHATNTQSQLSAMRESVSGVSTDEEMVSLMRFQRAYQASLQVIQTADEMLGSLMTLKR